MHFTPEFSATAELYLDLLKKCVSRVVFPDQDLKGDLTTRADFTYDKRLEGKDWPTDAETMIGLKRLENIQSCAVSALKGDVPGDFVETGVWRGGASIFMRGILKAFGDRTRTVWVADSFQGLPKPDPVLFPQDAGDMHHTLAPYLAVTLEQVKANFERYGLLDGQVQFLPGWFRDTLPAAPIKRIAVLRLDGDMYESTMEALTALYERVSAGGFVIIDDYGALPNCRAAVEDFRSLKRISDAIHPVDWTGVYWQKTV